MNSSQQNGQLVQYEVHGYTESEELETFVFLENATSVSYTIAEDSAEESLELNANQSSWLPSNGTSPAYGCFVRWDTEKYLLLSVLPIIFCLSVIGNCLVIVTIVQNKRMRTVTNTFLLNLAISDLLLSVFCMPQNLVSALFKCFLFGPVMCKIFSYMQPLSVTASAHTLVVIALERYFAICHPLNSRRWQTKKHAIKMIAAVWAVSLICNIPSAVLAVLREIGYGVKNCREEWPSTVLKQGYMIFLDFMLFVMPFLVMMGLYAAVIRTLWAGIQMEKQNNGSVSAKNSDALSGSPPSTLTVPIADEPCSNGSLLYQKLQQVTRRGSGGSGAPPKKISTTALVAGGDNRQNITRGTAIRSTHSERNLLAKKRVIKMLAAIVVEFFVCWMPLFSLRTAMEFNLIQWSSRWSSIYTGCLMLAYCSSCTNPITYCFMNKKMRQAFLAIFVCKGGSGIDKELEDFQRSRYGVGSTSTCCTTASRRAPPGPGAGGGTTLSKRELMELRQHGCLRTNNCPPAALGYGSRAAGNLAAKPGTIRKPVSMPNGVHQSYSNTNLLNLPVERDGISEDLVSGVELDEPTHHEYLLTSD